MELHHSPGIHACFKLRMDASTVRSIRGSSHWLYMNCGSRYICCFRMFGVDSGQIWTFSTLNKRAWVCDANTLSVFFAEHLTIETLTSFHFSLLLPSTGLDPLINKLLFSSLMIRWLRLSVLKACFACSTPYFSRSVAAHLSAPLHGLSRSKLPIEAKAVCFTKPLHSLLLSAR